MFEGQPRTEELNINLMEISKQNYLTDLNKSQQEAILNLDGPCLIVAGAGSGKTRVLTTRLAHIINSKKAWANQILCVTFTNKAAKEMQSRVLTYMSEKSSAVRDVWNPIENCRKMLTKITNLE